MKLSVIISLIRDEGVFNGIWTLLKLSKVFFFNVLLKFLYKRVYGEIPASDIIEYMKKKKYKLLMRKSIYSNIDDLIILKKVK